MFTDPDGGLFADPAGPHVVCSPGCRPSPPRPNGVMRQPGLKVFHVQDIDFRSRCLTLVACLRTIKRWSDDNPRHLPLMILLELKDDPIPDPGLGFVIRASSGRPTSTPSTEIRSVFSERELLTPDDVRGRHATLEEAVLKKGWPRPRGRTRQGAVRAGQRRRGEEPYLAGHPSLAGGCCSPARDRGRRRPRS